MMETPPGRPVPRERLLKSLQRAKVEIEQCIEAAEEHPPRRPLEPHDGLPRLRPHGDYGWQVWSGGICILLLSHEDVKPIVEAARSVK